MQKRTLIPVFLTLTLFSAFAMAAAAKSKPAELTVPDILDAAAMEDGSNGRPAADPCQDFYQFACGNWIDKTEIPGDKDRVMHQSTALLDRTDEELNKLILRLEKGDKSLQTPASRKIVDYYNSCMNFAKEEKSARALLKDERARVANLKDKSNLTALIAALHLDDVDAFFSFGSGQDLKDSNAVIGFLDQGGMGLPEPSYYLDKDAKAVETRKKYVAHVAKILELTGDNAKTAGSSAKTVMDIETRLAQKAMSFDERQDPTKINHPVTREDLQKQAPAIDWNTYFKGISAPASKLNLDEPDFYSHLSELIAKTPLADLKTYLDWKVVSRSAAEIGPKLDQEEFNFWSKYLHGEKKMKPRWKRCTQRVEHELGYAMAEVYVKTINAGAIRAKTQAMIDWIKQTFRDELTTLTRGKDAWLDSTTKAEALKKLDKLGEKLGAPEKWRDYSSLSMDPKSFISNDMSVGTFETKRDIAKIGKPLDRQEWDMMPWEINAYYDPPKNEFVFPFGILQPPSFDLKASDGANLGAFGGGTIGHELTHGYDNDGRQYDASGNVKDWWTPQTKKRFDEKTQCYIDQASAYKVKSVGLNVDGKKSISENLADQGGVKLGYIALQFAESKRAPAPLWQGKYPENQQYWIAYAQSWCEKARPESLRQQIKTNPHPPAEFRVNGVVMNRPEFAHDFNCKAGAPMAPEKRCSLW